MRNKTDAPVAHFQLKSTFQLTGRHFFLVGTIEDGQIEIGDYVKLRFNHDAFEEKILAIETVSKQQNGENFDELALGINEPTLNQKSELEEASLIHSSIEIFKYN
ncbi:hypothetical protein EV198_1625 [Roseivirga ehrenbergii]|uniref:Uncharacterized protein n=1 Tax=Roseivirga ehrenbergii (strain DSM 102268 / JCM 13514 / KCTC 12282 / NCIMB 14502 / KMM 6017) TaxID=279360 RepID=A0A150XS27_ROSEK|nr:hypothetical protein [Roseivirga ehrenbergii]KYG81445.1 hypothetical protein MB14_12680 [Roseivirga ehrenbergii]TCL10595.1 hypothetical protein EV198_1625 [Roseivirga ehrenbergii]